LKKIEEYVVNELASSKKSLWQLLENSQFPLKDLVQALGEMRKREIIRTDGTGFVLTPRGRKKVPRDSSLYRSSICDHCWGKRIVPQGKFQEVLAEFQKIARGRPAPSLEFFQGYMREEDVVARATLMHRYGDVLRRKIVLIGDDDLLSVVLSLTGMPSRVCVLDVDERLGNFLKEVNRDYGLDIEFRIYNVAEPLPEDLIGSFDVFSSEPLETMSGLKAFVGRGVGCLRDNGCGYFGLTVLEASYKKWLAVEKLLLRMNCVITDIIKDFSRYPMNYGTVNYESFAANLGFPVEKSSGVNWYKSTLFRFEALGRPRGVSFARKKLKVAAVDMEEDLTHPWANVKPK